MTGPNGSSTNRDRRREARRDQLQQRQAARRRERQRQLRAQSLRRYGIIGGAVLAAIVIIALVAHFATSAPSASHPRTIDGLQCLPSQGAAMHIHAYLEIYVNGQQQTVPAGVGIDTAQNCLYPLHVHDGEPNIIHVESNTVRTFTLGQFFDVWGKPLSKTQVEGTTANSAHPLTVQVTNASGTFEPYTGDPRAITLVDHETIAILYNSSNAHPQPFTNWQTLHGQ